MNTATWVVQDSKLGLVSQNGEVAWPSAIEVFGAAFRQLRTVAGLSVQNPFDELSGLTFSRLPAPVAVRIRRSVPNCITCDLGVITDAGFATIRANADSVIYEGRWYAISVDDLALAETWFSERRIRREGRLTIGDVIALRHAKDAPFRLLDDAPTDAKDFVEGDHVSDLRIAGLNADLYEYQRIGVTFLRLVSNQGLGCVLADEMGLGKTLQIIALFASEVTPKHFPNLVIAPATLLENWKREIRHFAPSLKVLVHAGSTRAGVITPLTQFDVVITPLSVVGALWLSMMPADGARLRLSD